MRKDSIVSVRSVSSRALEAESGERSEPDGAGRALAPPDPEVVDTPVRRRFSAEYKLRILHQADACKEPGSLGALLRREGLYASNLRTWRRQIDAGNLEALKPRKRGRKPLLVTDVEMAFRTAVEKIGLKRGPGLPRPTVHSLRHTFAVRALETCPDGRDNITEHMLALSTYLGHGKVCDTYWYLEAVPDLMRNIAEHCESFFTGGRP